MTYDYDDLFQSSARHDRKPPEGWTPGLTFDGARGTLTAPPGESEPDWNRVLAEYLPPGFDTSQYEIVPGSVSFTAWDGWGRDGQGDQAVSRKQYSFRARIRPAGTGVDMSELIQLVRKAKPSKRTYAGDRTLVVVWSDWQVGKDDGDGTKGTVGRLVDMVGLVEDRVRDLRRHGRSVGSLLVASLGDLGESCSGHYPQQPFRVELNERQQSQVIFDAAVRALRSWSRLFPQVSVCPVGGNHGEVRQDGKSFTDFSDNRDVAVFHYVASVLAESDAYEHVTFHIPTTELTQTIEASGTRIGMLHGHQAKKGALPEQRIATWWQGQMMGKHPIGDADILLSGHYHHFIAKEISAGRQWFQAPALDGGSEWWENVHGIHSPPSVLTFTVGADGWSDLALI